MRQQIFEEALESIAGFAKQTGHAYGKLPVRTSNADRTTLVTEINRLRWLLMRIEIIAEEATRRD